MAPQEDTLKEEMQKAYSLVRIELRDEETPEHQVTKRTNLVGGERAGEPRTTPAASITQGGIAAGGGGERAGESRTTPAASITQGGIAAGGELGEEERNKLLKEDEARARQVYDPLKKEYDERRRRVTDLAECARVTLPKPLSIRREAEIELRREIHDRTYQEFRKEQCDSKGEQESNMTSQEKKGLESLVQRMKKENLIIMKTDKSGKLCVTSEEAYKEMGKVHVEGDPIINREKIRELDRIMNDHSTAWCSMWGTGVNHQQEDRVQQSKTSTGENRAKLYLAYKDHKKEPFKTRPIGTACTSNTRAYANSVSDFLESLASSEENKYEVISTEDLLHHLMLHNREVEKKDTEMEKQKEKRWNCWEEKLWEKTCENCHSQENSPTRTAARNEDEESTEEEGIDKIIKNIIEEI